jgi:hypothetical protein
MGSLVTKLPTAAVATQRSAQSPIKNERKQAMGGGGVGRNGVTHRSNRPLILLLWPSYYHGFVPCALILFQMLIRELAGQTL